GGVHDDLDRPERARRHLAEALAERNRGRRSRGRDLDEADLLAHRLVVVSGPAQGVAVERARPVHVADRQDDQLDAEVDHDEAPSLGVVASTLSLQQERFVPDGRWVSLLPTMVPCPLPRSACSPSRATSASTCARSVTWASA